MDVINNAQRIEIKIIQIDELLDQLEQAANDKAEAAAICKRENALTILKIKYGLIKEFVDPHTGEVVPVGSNLAANLIPKIAEGINWEHELKSIATEAEYKSLVVKIEARRAQLNGYQSIFKVIS
jgi:hypothetical protein